MSQERQKLLARVTGLIERSARMSFAVPADTGHIALDHGRVAGVLEFLDDTAALLRDIGVYFEERLETHDLGEVAAGDDTDFLKQIGAGISTELAAREVADLAFMGRSEILEIRRELAAAIAEDSLWKIAAHADAGRGRAVRALVPVESAIREYEGMPAMRRRWENLEDSLEIRRQYAMLWRAVLRAGEPEGEELEPALRKIANRIAILRHLKIYPLLRIDDRLSIRKLQKRILEQLEGGDELTGRRLWSDVVAFFSLLMQVNRRQELREHDRQVVLAVHHELSRGAYQGDRIPSQTLERLESLWGRDAELDQVLLRPAKHRPRDCLAPLERLKQELQRTKSTPVTSF